MSEAKMDARTHDLERYPANAVAGTVAGTVHRRQRQAWLGSKVAPTGSAHRLFCFAYAGGSASVYHRWTEALGPGFEVCPVELPGHIMRLREPAYESIDALLDDLLPGLLPYMRQPFSLFGYSLGALIAYVLASRLQQHHGVEPRHLLVGAAKPPQLVGRVGKLGEMSDAALLDALGNRYAPIPEPIVNEPELLRVVLRITRSDFRILESYNHQEQPPLRCPITVFGGESDHGVDRMALPAWQELTESRCTVQMLPGNHFFINQCGAKLVAAVRAALLDHDQP